MTRDELMVQLFKYGEAIKSGNASVQDFSKAKNAIRQAYDAGNLDKDLMKQLGDKASFAFKNIGRTPDLLDLPTKVIEKGGTVSALGGVKSRFPTTSEMMGGVKNVANMDTPQYMGIKELPSSSTLSKVEDVGRAVNEDTGGVLGSLKNAKGFSKVLPMLGMGAAGLAALSIGNKAMAGEYGQAGLESADLGTDYVPGLSQMKMALRPTELGNAELPEEMMKERELYNAARQAKGGGVVNNPSDSQTLIAPEDRIKKEDLDNLFKNTMSRIKK